MAKMVLDPKNELVRKGNPAESSRAENHLLKTTGLQQIYYGAPGTGKSKTIKDLTFGESVIRTTFHPDSDYASLLVPTNLLQKKLISEIAMAKGN